MPAVPAALAAAVAGTLTTGLVASAVFQTAMVVHGVMQARKAKKQARAAYEASMRDRTVVIRSSDAPRTIVYGRTRVSGPLAYAKAFGEYNERLSLVVALGGHEFDAIEDVWFNDESIGPLDANGWVTGGRYSKSRKELGYKRVTLPASGQVFLDHVPDGGVVSVTYGTSTSAWGDDNGYHYTPATVAGQTVSIDPSLVGKIVAINYTHTVVTPLVRVKRYRGTAAGERDLDLEAASGGQWTSAHVGKGVPRLHVTLIYDEDVFTSGIPNISAIVRGKRVRDTRTGATAWSNNSTLCARDYIVDELGFDEEESRIRTALCNAAANVCDELVPGYTPSAGIRQSTHLARYTCDGVLSTDEDRIENLQMLLGSMVGTAAYSGGEWLIRAGAYVTPDTTGLNASHLADGPIEVTSAVPRRELFNTVQGRFIDPWDGYQVVDFPRYRSSTYIAMDNGDELARDIVLPMTDNASRAQRIGKLILHRSRQATTISATWKLAAYKYQPGDTLPLTIDYLGWSNKIFRVVDRKLIQPASVHLVLQEEAPEVYAWDFDEDKTPDPAPNTTFPQPWFVAALTNMQVASGPSYTRLMQDGSRQAFLRISWDAHPDAGVRFGGKIEVRIKRAPDLEYQLFEIDGSATFFEYNVADNEIYNIAVRARNGSQSRSNYVVATHTVSGAYVQPPGINYLGEYATAPDPEGLPEGSVYKNTTDRDTYILSGGVWSTFIESGEGEPGSAKLLRLVYSSVVFKISGATANPSSILFVAEGQNLDDAPTWSITGGTLTGTGNTRTLAYANMTADSAVITITADGQSDTVTVFKLRDGSDAIRYALSNESITVSADSAGVVTAGLPAVVDSSIFIGTTNDTGGWSYTRTNGSGASSTINNTVGSATRGRLTITALTTDASFVDIVATKAGFPSQPRRVTISKSRQGSGGEDGLNGTRGSAHVYLSGYTTWNTATQAAVNSHFQSTYGGRVLNDAATVYSGTFSQTRLWNGASWVEVEVTIDGRVILPGTASGDILTPGTVTGDSLVALPNHGMSITPDPGFEDLSLWSLEGSQVPTRVSAGNTTKFGPWSLQGNGTNSQAWSKPSPIDKYKSYRATWLAASSSASSDRNMTTGVRFYDVAGNIIAGPIDPAGWLVDPYHYAGIINAKPPSDRWQEYSATFGPGEVRGIPANAVRVSIGAHINVGGTTGNNYVSGLRIQQLQDTDLLAPNAATDVTEIADGAIALPFGFLNRVEIASATVSCYAGDHINATISIEGYAQSSASGPVEIYGAWYRGGGVLLADKMLLRANAGSGIQHGTITDTLTFIATADGTVAVSYHGYHAQSNAYAEARKPRLRLEAIHR